jgi:cbb3-type cytochrome oxidase subunit 3
MELLIKYSPIISLVYFIIAFSLVIRFIFKAKTKNESKKNANLALKEE